MDVVFEDMNSYSATWTADSWVHAANVDKKKAEMNHLAAMASTAEISREWWKCLQRDERFSELLWELDIADEDQVDLFDTFDVDGGGTLDFTELLIGIKRLRGNPRRSDVIAVSLQASSMHHDLRDFAAETKDCLIAQAKLLR